MKMTENVKKAAENVKTWGENHPKTVRFGKALLAGALKATVGTPETPSAPAVKEGDVLDAKQVMALQNMSSWQLSRIFRNKHVTFASDPETLKALSRLSSWQIDSILGQEEE